MGQLNNKANLVQPLFEVGDYVLVREAEMNKGHKQYFRWTGPRVIERVNGEVVCNVRNITDNTLETVHAVRKIKYKHKIKHQNISEDILKHAQHSESKVERIEELMEITKQGKDAVSYTHLTLPTILLV